MAIRKAWGMRLRHSGMLAAGVDDEQSMRWGCPRTVSVTSSTSAVYGSDESSRPRSYRN
jgi:hypothetical protein